jgi:predicted metal-binding protein
MLYKIKHYRTTKLHQRAHKTTKQTKHGNLHNDLANVQKSCFLLLFFNVDRSLYKFPCFVFLVICGEGPCNFIIQSSLILCNTTEHRQKSQSRYFEQFRANFEQFWGQLGSGFNCSRNRTGSMKHIMMS